MTPAQQICPDPIYFQVFYTISAQYRDCLLLTHERDEIETQMRLYIPMIHRRTRTDLNVFYADDEIVRSYANGEFTKLINAITYAKKYESEFDPFPMLEKTFSEYRSPSNVEELLMKTEIAGDKKWADFWRKYVTT